MGKRKLLLKYLCSKRRFGSGKVSFIAARIEATLTLRSVPNIVVQIFNNGELNFMESEFKLKDKDWVA
jgi:hypothetical protein